MSIELRKIGRAAVAIVAMTLGAPVAPALAQGPTSPAGETSPHTSPAPAGLAILAPAGASDAAWPLAASVYGTPSLRPPSMDDARARVLCGEAPAAAAPADLRDLAQTVAAVTGDDAPSRALLGDIAHRLGLRALVVVRIEGDGPRARVFLPDQGAFDAASYTPDGSAPPWSWSGAARSLARAFGSALPVQVPASEQAGAAHAPSLAVHELPKDEGQGKPFYVSGWFWGAVGAAAFAGAAIFLATRDSGPSTIHLQIEVPH